MFLRPEELLPTSEAPTRHKHIGPAPSPGAHTDPFYRGKRGLIAENNLTENEAQEPFTVSPNSLSYVHSMTCWHALSPSLCREAGAAFKAGSD